MSAAAAYRKDLVGRSRPFGTSDGEWVAVATLVQHAAMLEANDRLSLVLRATDLASALVGRAEIDRLSVRDAQSHDRMASEAIVLLANQLDAAGAFNLEATLLQALDASDGSMTPVHRGRVTAKRARVTWKQGHIPEAEELYRTVRRMGRASRSDELQARAYIGMAAIAQMRGNYPEVQRYSQRAARIAKRAGLRALGRLAQNGLAIAAAKSRRFDEALAHAWAAYQTSVGDSIWEAESLLNVGQVLLDSGHVQEARAAFAEIVVKAMPGLIMLPALGGLAMASALSDHAAWVDWADAQIDRLQKANVERYALASALLECASALDWIGRHERSHMRKGAARQLAEQHGFHEILYRLEQDLATHQEAIAAPAPYAPPAARVARTIAAMGPDALPEAICLAVDGNPR